MKKFKWLPSPAMVVAVVALMAATAGGTAYALTVTSADIVDGTIRNVDIRNRTITRGKVVLNTLTGAEIRESTLGIVPNADRLDGFHASQLVRKAESFTGYFSCAGTAWENASSGSTHFSSGSLKFSTNFATFRCSVNLPHGARVIAVNFGVRDLEAASNVFCFMFRTNMTAAIGTETLMASVNTNGTPENVRISTTSITGPVIDNQNFAYYLSCSAGANSNLGLYGGIVRYTVSGQRGAGS